MILPSWLVSMHSPFSLSFLHCIFRQDASQLMSSSLSRSLILHHYTSRQTVMPETETSLRSPLFSGLWLGSSQFPTTWHLRLASSWGISLPCVQVACRRSRHPSFVDPLVLPSTGQTPLSPSLPWGLKSCCSEFRQGWFELIERY